MRWREKIFWTVILIIIVITLISIFISEPTSEEFYSVPESTSVR